MQLTPFPRHISTLSLLALAASGCATFMSAKPNLFESPESFQSLKTNPCDDFYAHACENITANLKLERNQSSVRPLWDGQKSELDAHIQENQKHLESATSLTGDAKWDRLLGFRMACENKDALQDEIRVEISDTLKVWAGKNTEALRTAVLKDLVKGQLLSLGLVTDAQKPTSKGVSLRVSTSFLNKSTRDNDAARDALVPFLTEWFTRHQLPTPQKHALWLSETLFDFSNLEKGVADASETRFLRQDWLSSDEFRALVGEEIYESLGSLPLGVQFLGDDKERLKRLVALIANASQEELEALLVWNRLPPFSALFLAGTASEIKTLGAISKLSPAFPQKQSCATWAKRLYPTTWDVLNLQKWIQSDPSGAEAARQEGYTLFNKIKKSALARIENNTWLTKEGKEQLKEKINAVFPRIGYPEQLDPLIAARETPAHTKGALHTARQINLWELSTLKSALGQTTSRDTWSGFSALQVNASNTPSRNAISLPFVMLHPPFFNSKGDPILNYGRLGWTVAHELSHSFDTKGFERDKNGIYTQWMPTSDKEKYAAEMGRLESYYAGTQKPWKLASGENVADALGLQLAYEAAFSGRNPTSQDKKRFFYAAASKWCELRSKASIERARDKDPHSPAPWRVNATVQQMDSFQETFACKPGNALYVAPESRVRIW